MMKKLFTVVLSAAAIAVPFFVLLRNLMQVICKMR